MKTPSPARPEGRGYFASFAVRAVLPLALFGLVLAVFYGERLRLDHELSISAPTAVRPGETLPVRGLVVRAPDGTRPELSRDARVDVTLSAGGRTLVEQRLSPSAVAGVEGVLAVPPHARGELTLTAVARDPSGRSIASVARSVRVEAEAQGAPPVERVRGELMSLGLRPSMTEWPGADEVRVRVVGDACVPDARCTVLLRLPDEPDLVVTADDTASVRLLAPVPAGGVLRPLTVVTHGLEAGMRLHVTRGDDALLTIALQLPIALATVDLEPPPDQDGDGAGLSPRSLGQPTAAIVDAFRDGRWRATETLDAGRSYAAELARLEPGLWRLQVRTDPFSSRSAAVRHVLVLADDDDPEAAFRAAALALDPDAPADAPAELAFAWAAADAERFLVEPPPLDGGRAENMARMAEQRAWLRAIAAIGLLLGVAVFVFVVARRGLRAADEAQRVLEATGDEALASPAHRRRTRASALVLVATAAVALLAGAALLMVRASLIE